MIRFYQKYTFLDERSMCCSQNYYLFYFSGIIFQYNFALCIICREEILFTEKQGTSTLSFKVTRTLQVQFVSVSLVGAVPFCFNSTPHNLPDRSVFSGCHVLYSNSTGCPQCCGIVVKAPEAKCPHGVCNIALVVTNCFYFQPNKNLPINGGPNLFRECFPRLQGQ